MKHPARVSLAVKLAYTAFVAVMVPIYWHDYGPQNFLYFCDVAVLLTLVGIWTENKLLVSMQAVGILLPQLLWIADFTTHLVGIRLMGMTDYMFDPKLALHLRAISLFHGWLPILLLWLVWKLGYDRRAIFIQPIICVGLLLICYFCFVPPGTLGSHRMPVNINYVFGMSETVAQTRMPPIAWLAVLIVGIPTLLYLPAHFILRRFPRKPITFGQMIPPQSPASLSQ